MDDFVLVSFKLDNAQAIEELGILRVSDKNLLELSHVFLRKPNVSHGSESLNKIWLSEIQKTLDGKPWFFYEPNTTVNPADVIDSAYEAVMESPPKPSSMVNTYTIFNNTIEALCDEFKVEKPEGSCLHFCRINLRLLKLILAQREMLDMIQKGIKKAAKEAAKKKEEEE